MSYPAQVEGLGKYDNNIKSSPPPQKNPKLMAVNIQDVYSSAAISHLLLREIVD